VWKRGGSRDNLIFNGNSHAMQAGDGLQSRGNTETWASPSQFGHLRQKPENNRRQCGDRSMPGGKKSGREKPELNGLGLLSLKKQKEESGAGISKFAEHGINLGRRKKLRQAGPS